MLRRVIVVIVALAGGIILALWGVRLWADSGFYEGYFPAYPVNAEESEPIPVEGTLKAFKQELPARYRRISLAFDGPTGERIPAILTLPMEGTGPFPALILLHGSHQEKEFVEQISTPFNEAGFAMVCFDQYMRGERKVQGGTWTMMRAFRERCRKTVHETRRMVDYLQTRPDIDPERIYLVGASYGAITGVVALAQEKRIKAGALVVGGGNFRLLARAPEVQRELPGWLLPFAGSLMVALMGVADPIHHAHLTAGTPVIMLNGSNDSVVTPESGEALFAALGEPKEIRWYPVDHPDREKDGAKVISMLDDGLKWFLEIDAPHRIAQESSSSADGGLSTE